MQAIHDGYRGLGLILNLNWDRILYVLTIVVALGFGTLLGSLLQ
ncbi:MULTISPECIES: hypothetical protein [unclassified Roseivivax]|nr:hypothetical protein [Roseivivax sp. GX 12232]